MEQMPKKRVPVTEEEKQKSYYKYFEQDMAQPAQEALAKMLQGPLRPDQVLQFKDRNRLFEPGYLEAEAGWCILPDGTGYLANLTKMPGVTPEMIDWFFAWHGLDNLRYKIWNHGRPLQSRNTESCSCTRSGSELSGKIMGYHT